MHTTSIYLCSFLQLFSEIKHSPKGEIVGHVCVSHQWEKGSVLYIMFYVTVSASRTENIKLCKIKFELIEPLGKQSLWFFLLEEQQGPLWLNCARPMFENKIYFMAVEGADRFPTAGVASRKLQRRRVHVSKLNSSRTPYTEKMMGKTFW